jgi:8-oxo-dGTP diphosphatase
MEERKPSIGSAVLVEHEGKFLLGERNKESYRGYWVIPGGRVEFGETVEDAGKREIKEETGLDVEIIRFIGHKEIINAPENYHRIVFFHLARTENSGAIANDDISNVGFFTLNEIKEMKIAESVEWALREAGFWK